ncbi:MAG: quinone oxidoreductase family protein [Janthinobacterium lividum]
MRAAIIDERNGTPKMVDIPEPEAVPGTLKIAVSAAGLGPTDIMRSAGTYKTPKVPYIIGGEGTGRSPDGGRVYFGHSIESSGAFGDWTIVPEEEVWPIPDDIDDGQAIALAITGTGALIPLEEAKIKPGERVLILGATGPLGQIALQLSRAMGAGSVVAAARTRSALDRLAERGIADGIVHLGQGDDVAALKAGAGSGYDVVLDCVYGPPAEAAMKAMAPGGRMMSIGVGAGMTMTLSLRDLVMRSHHGVGTGHRPVAERRAAYERLLGYHREGKLDVEILWFDLDHAPEAWAAQVASPGAKIVLRTRR